MLFQKLWLFSLLAIGTLSLAITPPLTSDKVLVVPKGAAGASVELTATIMGGEAKAKTSAQVCWDDTALTVTFTCRDATIVAQQRERDQAIWEDDCVEIFLDPGHTHDQQGKWLHIIVNPLGSIFDAINEDATQTIDGLTVQAGKVDLGLASENRPAVERHRHHAEAGRCLGIQLEP